MQPMEVLLLELVLLLDAATCFASLRNTKFHFLFLKISSLSQILYKSIYHQSYQNCIFKTGG